MAYVSQLLAPRVLAQLTDEQFARIISIVDGEVQQNAALRKAVTAKVNEALKSFKAEKTEKK